MRKCNFYLMNQKNQVEIERKFIVKKLPQNLDKYSSEDIEQKYLTSPENEVEIRLRRKGDKYFQTTKKGNGKSRLETETEISENKFKQLEVSALGRKIEKKRYSIPYGSETIELDIYKGDLTGLTVAEVE